MMEDYGYCSKTGVCFNLTVGVLQCLSGCRNEHTRYDMDWLIAFADRVRIMVKLDKITKDGVACIDLNYYWRPIEEAPHGVKLQLLSVYGVASHGSLSPAIIEDGFWIGWTPLPDGGSND